MQNPRWFFAWVAVSLVLVLLPSTLLAEESVILTEKELAGVVPASFYLEGKSATTQMYNATAIRFGEKRHLIATLVDMSGYATAVREKIEGFLVTDIPVRIGNKELGVGYYPFGFTKEGVLNVFDLAGTPLFSAKGTKDSALRAPRPLAMVKGADGIRLYRGKDYVTVAPK
jgi:hypothetical protein